MYPLSPGAGFRSPYPSALPISTSSLPSDFYRFSPTGLIPPHPGLSPHPPHLSSHPAIVTPGPKQELPDLNHRWVHFSIKIGLIDGGERFLLDGGGHARNEVQDWLSEARPLAGRLPGNLISLGARRVADVFVLLGFALRSLVWFSFRNGLFAVRTIPDRRRADPIQLFIFITCVTEEMPPQTLFLLFSSMKLTKLTKSNPHFFGLGTFFKES